MQKCRFIDSNYKTLFTVPDGGKIIITYPNKLQKTMTCKHIDDYHTNIGGNNFHICQFAELMENMGANYKPVKAKNLER